jgi:glycolate oxidase
VSRRNPGVTNLAITHAVEADGFYYAPDPSSQIACSIGGNVAENSGGVHCLKYGLTANNLLGIEMVLMDGEIVRLGGKYLDSGGYDLLGIVTGSEGLLGVITEVTVRMLRKPSTARALLIGFPSSESAGDCVARIIGAGIIPGGMEMMDKPAVHAAEAFVNAGYPLDAEALLIVELDGPEVEVDELIVRVEAIARENHADSVRISTSEAERDNFWAGRKAAFPAVGRISPDYYCMDGTIPRHRLSEVLTRMNELSGHYDLRVANVFHAGDGNLHPLILYDANKPGELEKAEEFGSDILRLCVEVGGVLTGEHGVGVEKRDLMGEMFNEVDLNQQQRVKCAFDPTQQLNPGKVFPTLHRCAELGRVHMHSGQTRFPRYSPLLTVDMAEKFDPATTDDVRAIVADALASKTPLEIAGNGSKREIGRPVDLNYELSTARLSGVSLYEPDELVLRAGPGTPDETAQVAARTAWPDARFRATRLRPPSGRCGG